MKFASGGGGRLSSTANDDAMTVAGIASAWSEISSVETWNGTNWTSGTAKPATRGLNSFR